MIRTWCKDHPIQFMACYLVFYLAFFKLLEQGIQVPDLVLHCRLDDLIPFCKYAIIPYYLSRQKLFVQFCNPAPGQTYIIK